MRVRVRVHGGHLHESQVHESHVREGEGQGA